MSVYDPFVIYLRFVLDIERGLMYGIQVIVRVALKAQGCVRIGLTRSRSLFSFGLSGLSASPHPAQHLEPYDGYSVPALVDAEETTGEGLKARLAMHIAAHSEEATRMIALGAAQWFYDATQIEPESTEEVIAKAAVFEDYITNGATTTIICSPDLQNTFR